MIDSPPVVFFNTHGVLLLVAFVVLYEIFIARQKEVAWHALLSVAAAVIMALVLKELFLVPRPYLTTGGFPQAGLYFYSSLPSIHAAIAFALATTVTMHQRNLGVFLFTIATLFGIGRVLANVHYPFDIILGLFIGILTGVIFNQIHIRFRKR
jgi:undecaprenyl-diphosphatase